MSHLTVDVARDGRYWRITTYVNGAVEPTTVFGCRDGIAPIVEALLTAQAQQDAAWSGAESRVRGVPSTITLHLPGDRSIIYGVILPEEMVSQSPQFPARAAVSGGAGDPVNTAGERSESR